MSEELALLESCLKEAESLGDGQEDVNVPEMAQADTENAIHSLIESLRGRHFTVALAQVKTFR